MRLYHQLSDEERENATNHCVGIVLHDMLDSQLNIDALSDEDKEAEKIIKKSVKEALQFESRQEQINQLIQNEKVMNIAFDIAEQMISTAYYMDMDDFVVFPHDYYEGECEDCKKARETEEQQEHDTKHKHKLN